MSVFQKYFDGLDQDPEFLAVHAVHDFTLEIHRLMEKHGINKAELARRLGTSQAYVTKMLSGNANFTIKTMTKIAAAFGERVHIHLDPGPCEESRATVWEKLPWPGRPGQWTQAAEGWADTYRETEIPAAKEECDESAPLAA
ncbi:helix-turn-helix domain-containing protein [Deferrisoma camini]|uniref:helix-turn-helix domain-containing protein n=1 Tax=Deferrisoma camini TaxID=1035120 RepID=UPI00046CD5D9|nr:helix-turn-helix transcriptional regulator [Deferrisoma camini]